MSGYTGPLEEFDLRHRIEKAIDDPGFYVEVDDPLRPTLNEHIEAVMSVVGPINRGWERLRVALSEVDDELAARPAPVDPAAVRIGDLVEVSFHGLVVGVAGHVMTTRDRHGSDTYFSTKDATVRVLDRGGPDPAEVEALYQVLYETHSGGVPGVEPPDERWSGTYRHIARRLAARGVKVRDEH